jgi:hypothetical protein
MWRPTRPPAQQCGDGSRDLDLIDQSGVYLLPGRLPGAGVGGPGAWTGGVNRLPPVGLIDFSTGDGGGGAGVAGGGGVSAAGDVVAVVGVVGSGAFSSFAQAESTPMAMIAPMPAVATRRRAIRPDLMIRPICIVNLNYIVQKIPRQRLHRKTRHALSGVAQCRATDDTVQLSRAVKSGQEMARIPRIRYLRPPERSRLSKLAKTSN